MTYLLIQSDARQIPLADRSVDLVLGSPPYCDARTYGINAQRNAYEWVDWMLDVTTEALRVARNCVIWIAAGVTRDRTYWPACEGLMWEWYKRGGSAYRPCYWRRVGIPGSGGDDWFRFDVEYCMCFKKPGPLDWSDNTANGSPPVYGPGGAMSNRTAKGARINDPWNTGNRDHRGGRKPDGMPKTSPRLQRGSEKGTAASIPVLANPGNLIDTGVTGGGHLGHALAHKNEAPFPEKIPEWFIRSLCKPCGIVLDPFSGSGTTVSVAIRLGRIGIGGDLRPCQAEIAKQRIERPHQPITRQRKQPMPLFGLT